MYTPKPNLRYSLSEDQFLWRYIDFTKFMSLLNDRSLFFSRLDKLGDPFEGSFPIADHKHFEGISSQFTPEKFMFLPEAERELEALYQRDFALNIGRITARSNGRMMYVNCWHSNTCESAAMWKLYLKSDEGIAIRSTTKRFAESFDSYPGNVNIGEVSYIDFTSDRILSRSPTPEGRNDEVYFKRNSFSHEREVRAVVVSPIPYRGGLQRHGDKVTIVEPPDEGPFGLKIPVDLECLIEGIYVAPSSPPWFRDLVDKMAKKFEIGAEVRQSSLDESPIV